MGMRSALARMAVQATRVLVIEVAGHWSTRIALEGQMLRRGWRLAWSPAEADVLAVCGTPGDGLAPLVDRLWDQMPGPRVRIDLAGEERVEAGLDEAERTLLDPAHHAHDASTRRHDVSHGDSDHDGHQGMHLGKGRSQQDHHATMEHGGNGHQTMDHGSEVDPAEMHHRDTDQGGQANHDHLNHGAGHHQHGTDRAGHHDGTGGGHHNTGGDHAGHDGMDRPSADDSDAGSARRPDEPDMHLEDGTEQDHHAAMEHGGHGGHDHGSMDMAPAGIALAEGGPDRDGLEMDVLHLPLGPVLPFWPVGLVLTCSLQGDVVVEADASMIDSDEEEIAVGGHDAPESAAVQCDHAMALLALAGADDAAATARIARDAVASNDWDRARMSIERLHRTVRRSVILRWALRGVLPLTASDLDRGGLPTRFLGDAYDRLLMLVADAADGIEGAAVTDRGARVRLKSLPDLVVGMDVATVRLAIASLACTPVPSRDGAGRG